MTNTLISIRDHNTGRTRRVEPSTVVSLISDSRFGETKLVIVRTDTDQFTTHDELDRLVSGLGGRECLLFPVMQMALGEWSRYGEWGRYGYVSLNKVVLICDVYDDVPYGGANLTRLRLTNGSLHTCGDSIRTVSLRMLDTIQEDKLVEVGTGMGTRRIVSVVVRHIASVQEGAKGKPCMLEIPGGSIALSDDFSEVCSKLNFAGIEHIPYEDMDILEANVEERTKQALTDAHRLLDSLAHGHVPTQEQAEHAALSLRSALDDRAGVLGPDAHQVDTGP